MELPEDSPLKDVRGLGDGQLAAAIGRLSEPALAEVYRRHAGPVLTLARSVLGDRALAEETTQEVFLRLWQQPHRYDPARGSLRSYLLADVHGRSVDLVRREVARRGHEKRDARMQVNASGDLEREVWECTVAQHIRDALDELPPEERSAIELAYFGGMTYREVAAALREPEGTIKSRIRAGLRHMRAALGTVGIEGSWQRA